MNRYLKYFIGGLTAVLAGVGIYKLVNSQKKRDLPEPPWTTAKIPDLTAKVIIVTGANSGIGYEAAKEFARKNAQVILACRSLEKAETAVATIQAEIPHTQAEIMQLDLASQASVHQFAAAFKAKYDKLDILVNNAGIMMVPYAATVDGFESQFATNHLGHFALTGLLLDYLLKTPGSRVVNVSSIGHRMGNMDFDNLNYANGKDYSPQRAYGRSKLANLLFTYEMQRHYQKIGADAMAVAAHPGSSQTNLGNHLYDNWYAKLLMPILSRMMQDADMGALPTIRAAVDPNVKGGDYYGPHGFMEQNGFPVIVQSNEASHNLADAKRLWEVSEELTGVAFGPLD